MRNFFSRRPLLCLALVCAGYFFVQAALVMWNPPATINMESDNLLYDAKLVAEGVIPFVELFTRSLVPLYLYAGLFAAFGIHIKLIALVGQLAIALAGYCLGRIAFTLTRQLSGSLISVASYWLIGGREIVDAFVLAALWLVIIWANKKKWWLAGGSGLLAGAAVLSYQAAIAWAVVISLCLLYHLITHRSPSTVRLTVKSLAAFFSGLSISLVLPLAWFVWITDWQWMSKVYLVDQLFYTIAALGLLCSVLCIIFRLTAPRSWLVWMIHSSAVGLIILFVALRPELLNVKIAAIHDFTRIAVWAILPTLAIVWAGTVSLFQKQKRWLMYTVGGFIILLTEFIILGVAHTDRGPSLELSQSGKYYFLTVFLLLFFVIGAWTIRQKHSIRLGVWLPAIIGLSLSVMFGASLMYSEWLPSYIRNYAIGLALGTGLFIQWVRSAAAANQRQTILIMLVASLLSSIFLFPKMTAHDIAYNPAIEMRMSDALAAVSYIQIHSTPNDTLFTAVPLFALRSGRNLVTPITHPVAYLPQTDDPFGYDPSNVVPSISELIGLLQQKKPKFVVADQRTQSLFMSDRHPDINQYIRRHYTKKMEFGNIMFFERNAVSGVK